jgi:hypothetical protein
VCDTIIPIEALSRLSSGSNELLVAISEVLGVSLSEVCDLYFGDRGKVERDHIVEEAQEHYREDQQYEEDQKRRNIIKSSCHTETILCSEVRMK